MTQQQQQQLEKFHGLIVASTDRGIKLKDHDAWLNKSQFGPAAGIALPAKGTIVEGTFTTVNDRHYIQSLTVVSRPNAQKVEAQGTPTPAPAPVVDKDRRIAREATLNTATEILRFNHALTKTPIEFAEVKAWAAHLEALVYRESNQEPGGEAEENKEEEAWEIP